MTKRVKIFGIRSGHNQISISYILQLKLNIQKIKIMASGPTTSWEIDGETVETVSDFIFLGSKKIKSDTVSTVSPSISHEVMGPDAMIFVF